MWPVALLSMFGNLFKGFFGFKQAQADTIQTALKVLSDVSTSEAQREQAIAGIIGAEATSGYWLAACWRPLVAICLFGLIMAAFFGYVPPDIDKPLSPMLGRIFDLFEVCLYGYIPARTLEKVISNINLSSVVKQFINKGIG